MKFENSDLFNHPSTKQLLALSAIWLAGLVISVFAMTDSFEANFFQFKYLPVYILILASLVVMVKFYFLTWNSLYRD